MGVESQYQLPLVWGCGGGMGRFNSSRVSMTTRKHESDSDRTEPRASAVKISGSLTSLGLAHVIHSCESVEPRQDQHSRDLPVST